MTGIGLAAVLVVPAKHIDDLVMLLNGAQQPQSWSLKDFYRSAETDRHVDLD